MAKKAKKSRPRHSLTLEMVKAQLDSEDAVTEAEHREKIRQHTESAKLFEPIRAMWLEVCDCQTASGGTLKDSASAATEVSLKFPACTESSSFSMRAFVPGAAGTKPALFCGYNDNLGNARSLEEVQSEFIKYLARRLRPARKTLCI